jgi:hypothetical protein
MAQVSEFAKTGVNTIRPGLLWDGNSTIVSGKANMSLDVRAFSILTQRSATLGVMKWANDATVNLTKDVNGTNLAAPGSNSVYWNVFAWHREYSIDGTNSDPIIAILVGTPAASPSVPALTSYPGAVSLATVLVPAGTTATNSGTTITQTAPFTAAAGGVVPFRSTTERDAGTYLAGQLGWLIDSKQVQRYDGAGWASLSGLTTILPTASGTGASASSTGLVTLSACSSVSLNGLAGFRKVRIELEVTAASANNQAKLLLRSSSADDTSSNYDWQGIFASNTTISGVQSSAQAAWSGMASSDAQTYSLWIEIEDLDQARMTRATGETDVFSTSGPPRKGALSFSHRSATPWDGVTIAASTGTITGTVRVLGIA